MYIKGQKTSGYCSHNYSIIKIIGEKETADWKAE
jgi:hypothetical protein